MRKPGYAGSSRVSGPGCKSPASEAHWWEPALAGLIAAINGA